MATTDMAQYLRTAAGGISTAPGGSPIDRTSGDPVVSGPYPLLPTLARHDNSCHASDVSRSDSQVSVSPSSRFTPATGNHYNGTTRRHNRYCRHSPVLELLRRLRSQSFRHSEPDNRIPTPLVTVVRGADPLEWLLSLTPSGPFRCRTLRRALERCRASYSCPVDQTDAYSSLTIPDGTSDDAHEQVASGYVRGRRVAARSAGGGPSAPGVGAE